MKELPIKQNKDVISFINDYNHISIRDLEDVMEDLEDNGFLSEKGKEFRNAFWKMFIKK